jgi:putative ABC transport system substrate-binding protein
MLLAGGAVLLSGGLRKSARARERVPVVGMLITHPPVTDPVVDAVRTGLRAYGYRDGDNIALEVRTALGQLDRVPAIAEELVRLDPDVIVLANEPALRAVTQATRRIPIVMAGYTDDPAAIGWIDNYRRPGGNVTGVFTVNAALIAKRMELLRETLPEVTRVAVFWDPAFGKRQLEELQRLKPAGGLRLQQIAVRSPQQLGEAFDAAKHANAGAVLLIWSPMFYVNASRLGAIALEAKLPIFADINTIVQAGGLLSYGSLGTASFERAAYYIDRLLKGARAGDLPVEQMTNIKLVVNLKTARALGIRVPESVLLRADEVIR